MNNRWKKRNTKATRKSKKAMRLAFLQGINPEYYGWVATAGPKTPKRGVK